MQPELIETGALQRAIEALLFVASEALSIKQIAKLTKASEVEVTQAIARIQADFAGRGIVLRELAGGYRFASAPEDDALRGGARDPFDHRLSRTRRRTGHEGRYRSDPRRQFRQRDRDPSRSPLHRGERP